MKTHARRSGWRRLLPLAVGLILALSGCSTSPLAPLPGAGTPSGVAPASGPEVLVVYPDGTVGYTRPPRGDADATQAGDLVAGDLALRTSAEIDGSVGGKIRCGRFLLRVPAGAFEGKGIVGMSMEDSTVMIVDLHIEPADRNDFLRPVDLVVCTTGLDVSPDTLEIYWYSTDAKNWQHLTCDKYLEDEPDLMEPGTDYGSGSSDSTTMRGVRTPLTHFSRYSAGKAGW